MNKLPTRGHHYLVLYPHNLAESAIGAMQMSVLLVGINPDLRDAMRTIRGEDVFSVKEKIAVFETKQIDYKRQCRENKRDFWLLVPVEGDLQYLSNLVEGADKCFIFDERRNKIIDYIPVEKGGA